VAVGFLASKVFNAFALAAVAFKSFDNADFVAVDDDGGGVLLLAPKLPNDVLLPAVLAVLRLGVLFFCDENPLLNDDELPLLLLPEKCPLKECPLKECPPEECPPECPRAWADCTVVAHSSNISDAF
jgi:hypothetical protein